MFVQEFKTPNAKRLQPREFFSRIIAQSMKTKRLIDRIPLRLNWCSLISKYSEVAYSLNGESDGWEHHAEECGR